MQRRKFIAGMGSLAAAGAATIGTGAFTSVEADRTVSVEVAGDASAYLAITPAEEGGSDTDNAEDYVADHSGDTVTINLTESDEGAEGLNANAETKFANLLDITNQGTQKVNVGVQDNPGPILDGSGGTIDGGVFAEGPDTNTGGSGNPNFPDPDNDGDQDPGAGFSMPDDPVPLGVGQTVENIGLDINDPSTIPGGDADARLVIIALTDDAYEQQYGGTAPTFN